MEDETFARGIGLLVAAMQADETQRKDDDLIQGWAVSHATWILGFVGLEAPGRREPREHPDPQGFLERARAIHEADRAARKAARVDAARSMADDDSSPEEELPPPPEEGERDG